MDVCPKCGAPRVVAPECPRCGVIYARAHAAGANAHEAEPPRGVAAAAPIAAVPFELPIGTPRVIAEDGDAPDPLERRLRAAAIPAALVIGWLLQKTGMGHALLRTFMAMWVHESGHAVTAWFCGFSSFPGPWITPHSATRSYFLALALAAALAYVGWRALRSGEPEVRYRFNFIAVLCAALLVLQVIGTLGLSVAQANALIAFGGDGGALVLGSALMATFYAASDSALRRNGVRWGLLAIGAAGFTDAFELWWSAQSNTDRIPFGSQEYAGLSDPSVLQERYLWSTGRIVHSYVYLGCACLILLAFLYGRGLKRDRVWT